MPCEALSKFRNIVVIGASTGGPKALAVLLDEMPRVAASIILIQHIPAFASQSFADTLGTYTSMPVRMAEHGRTIEIGSVHVAPGDHHLRLFENRVIRIDQGPKVNFVRPSVDVTLGSLVRRPGDQVIGVILTGMGQDGAAGISYVKHSLDAVTIAQDEASSMVPDMPAAAAATGDVDHILPPRRIGEKLAQLLGAMPEK